tara:strand:- start:475 stop:648 length:174 start_codon:yes stop_codon:yes gene_type:complete
MARKRKLRKLGLLSGITETPIETPQAPTPAPVVEELITPVEEEPKKTRKRKALFSKD